MKELDYAETELKILSLDKSCTLTPDQATELLIQAYSQVDEHYRLGQAVWNLLPPQVAVRFHRTQHDFFYFKDTAKVEEIVYGIMCGVEDE